MDTHPEFNMSNSINTSSMVRHWHRLPGEVVEVPSLETYKVGLDGLSILTQL